MMKEKSRFPFRWRTMENEAAAQSTAYSIVDSLFRGCPQEKWVVCRSSILRRCPKEEQKPTPVHLFSSILEDSVAAHITSYLDPYDIPSWFATCKRTWELSRLDWMWSILFSQSSITFGSSKSLLTRLKTQTSIGER